MKALREIHDFVAGSSIIAPAGLAIAIIAALASAAVPPIWRAGVFTVLLLGTFVAATVFEHP